MAQVKIFGRRSAWSERRPQLSDSIHAAIVEVLALPAEKRFHRFFLMEEEDFIFPADRGEDYLILELQMFSGRSVETRKQLIRSLFSQLEGDLGLHPQNLEIVIVEAPRENWGIRGKPGDELQLEYKVSI